MTAGKVVSPGRAISPPKSIRERFLGSDAPTDLTHVIGLFAVFVALERGTGQLAKIEPRYLDDQSLLVGAVESRPALYALAALAGCVLIWRWPSRLWARWRELERGAALRWFAAPLLLLLAWQGAFYQYNFILSQSHLSDRLLLLIFGGLALARPVFLLPFALQSRVISSQFSYPFGTTSAQNIDEMLVLTLLAIAAIHILFTVTARRQTSSTVLLISAVVASHYFISGRSKLTTDWVFVNDLSNFPLSSYTAGWLGQGTGAWARRTADAISTIGRPALIATLVVELGSVLAAAHYKLMRLWLPLAITFHVVLFTLTGYWFLGWVILEIALLVILTSSRLSSWVRRNATPARATIAVAAVVVGGGFLFHPPNLTWFDGPVSYGYRFEVTTTEGDVLSLPASAFAPVEQEVVFMHLSLGDAKPVVGGYGYLGRGQRDLYEALQDVASVAELKELESSRDSVEIAISETFVTRLFDHINRPVHFPWASLSPPNHFWSGSSEPVFNRGASIESMDVFMVRSVHNGDPNLERELVLTVTAGEDGAGLAEFP